MITQRQNSAYRAAHFLNKMLVLALLIRGMGLPVGREKEVHAQNRVALGNPVIGVR